MEHLDDDANDGEGQLMDVLGDLNTAMIDTRTEDIFALTEDDRDETESQSLDDAFANGSIDDATETS